MHVNGIPSDVSFDQGKMGKNSVYCLEKGRFWTFSAIAEHRRIQ